MAWGGVGLDWVVVVVVVTRSRGVGTRNTGPCIYIYILILINYYLLFTGVCWCLLFLRNEVMFGMFCFQDVAMDLFQLARFRGFSNQVSSQKMQVSQLMALLFATGEFLFTHRRLCFPHVQWVCWHYFVMLKVETYRKTSGAKSRIRCFIPSDCLLFCPWKKKTNKRAGWLFGSWNMGCKF